MSDSPPTPPESSLYEIRGKTYIVLTGVKIPFLHFHPDTPKRVVWLEG